MGWNSICLDVVAIYEGSVVLGREERERERERVRRWMELKLKHGNGQHHAGTLVESTEHLLCKHHATYSPTHHFSTL